MGSTQNKKLQLKTSSTSILISGCSNDLQNVEEQIDDVEVEVERSKDILLGVQRILVVATHHHLGVEDDVEAEDDCPNYCKNQSCTPSLREEGSNEACQYEDHQHASNAPPQAVKSTLVCMAKRVRAKTTPAVIPTAISTSVTSYVEQMAPISQPSHRVKSPRKIRL